MSHFLAQPLDELHWYFSSDQECTLGGTVLIVLIYNTGFHGRAALGFLPGETKLGELLQGGTQRATAMSAYCARHAEPTRPSLRQNVYNVEMWASTLTVLLCRPISIGSHYYLL